MMPYPVGPADAGSTPSTRKHISLPAEVVAAIAAFIDISLRRSPCPCQSFVCEFLGKRKTAIQMFGMAMKEKNGKEKHRQKCLSYKLARADSCLNLRLIDVEVRVNVLHVVVFFQRFNQTHHL